MHFIQYLASGINFYYFKNIHLGNTIPSHCFALRHCGQLAGRGRFLKAVALVLIGNIIGVIAVVLLAILKIFFRKNG